MAEKKIVWSTRASFELKDVLEFYTQRNGNPNYSLKILNEIEIYSRLFQKVNLLED